MQGLDILELEFISEAAVSECYQVRNLIYTLQAQPLSAEEIGKKIVLF